MVYLTRRYRFSAAHRLHNDALSAEDNRRLYGKCDNPFGHGHNYVLDVTMAGEVDPATGMVFDLAKLDATVEREVLERFEKYHLRALPVTDEHGRLVGLISVEDVVRRLARRG